MAHGHSARRNRSDFSDQTQRFNQQTKRRAPAAGADPRLRQLEAALEQERETSRQAAHRLEKLRKQEQRLTEESGPRFPVQRSSEWTVSTLKEHFQALRDADFRFYEERDRRYTEVNIEREKALKIKETADLAALSLAREIQDYKDEKANNLRDQIGAERGTYATKDDLSSAVREVKAVMDPLKDYVASNQGRGVGKDQMWQYLVGGLGAIAILWTLWHSVPQQVPPPSPGTVGSVPLPFTK
jgi:hypothetical protein